jgi:hypothetical protein
MDKIVPRVPPEWKRVTEIHPPVTEKKRGRPAKADTLSNAERQRRFKAKRAA